ncbi:MAG: hypothetical protein WA913_10270, partial [Pricia sp.]
MKWIKVHEVFSVFKGVFLETLCNPYIMSILRFVSLDDILGKLNQSAIKMKNTVSIKTCLSLLLGVFTTHMAGQRSINIAKVEDRVLATLDAEFNESFAWWARVYDSESGGCFYSLSAKNAAPTDPRFAPDIESTSKLVGILHRGDLLESTSSDFKAKMTSFLQGRQNPASGLFRDPQHDDQYTHLTLSRVTSMALGTIGDLGGEPLYLSPLSNKEDNDEAAEVLA